MPEQPVERDSEIENMFKRRLVLFIPLIIFIALGSVLFKALFLNPQELPSALLNKSLPSFSQPDLYDQQVMISEADLKGEVSLLNVWATWCPSCHAEHAFLLKLKQQHGVKIFGISYKDDRTKAINWLEKTGNPYARNISDEKGRLGLNLGVYGAPETYLLDENGVIRYKHVGVLDERVWQTIFKPIIDELKNNA